MLQSQIDAGPMKYRVVRKLKVSFLTANMFARS